MLNTLTPSPTTKNNNLISKFLNIDTNLDITPWNEQQDNKEYQMYMSRYNYEQEQ